MRDRQNIEEYELSIWQDYIDSSVAISGQMPKFTTDGTFYSYYNEDTKKYETINKINLDTPPSETKTTNGFSERKIMIIGTSNMFSPIHAFNIKLVKNINGTNNLTFKILRRYLPNDFKKIQYNPIIKLLKNDTKLKLKYNNEWFEFIVHSLKETSEENTLECTAVDAFIEELSRTGYSLDFNETAFNNTDTIYNLGKEIVKGTDWIVRTPSDSGTDISDIIRQKRQEPVCLAKIKYVNGNNYNTYRVEDDELLPRQSQAFNSSSYTWAFIPYSALCSPTYRFPFLFTSSSSFVGNSVPPYTTLINDQGILSNVYNYYLEYAGQYSVVNNNELYYLNGSGQKVSLSGTITLYKPEFISEIILLTDCKGEFIVYPQLYYKHDNLKSLYSVYSKGNLLYFGEQEYKSTYSDTKNLIINSTNFNSGGFSTRIVSNWRPGTAKPVLERQKLLKIDFGSSGTEQDLVTVYNKAFTTSDMSDGFKPGERYLFRINFSAALKIPTAVNGTLFSRYRFLDPALSYRRSNETADYLNSLDSSDIDNSCIDGKTRKSTSEMPLKVGVEVYIEGDGNNSDIVLLKSFPDHENDKVDGWFYNYAPYAISNKFGINNTYNIPDYDSLFNNDPLLMEKDYTTINAAPYLQSTFFQPIDYSTDTINNELNGDNFGRFIEKNYSNKNIIDPCFRWFEQILFVNRNINYSASEIQELSRQGKIKIRLIVKRITNNGLLADYTYCKSTAFYNGEYARKSVDYNWNTAPWAKCYIEGIVIQNIQLFKYTTDITGQRVYPDVSQTNLQLGTKKFYKYFEAGDLEGGYNPDIINLDNKNDIKWIYDEPYEYNYSLMIPQYDPYAYKISSINASKSNRFNLIQTLCDNFECWAKFRIKHNSDGTIARHSDGRLKKYITFHNYVSKERSYGFTYGRNLKDIQRTIVSDKLTTKIIVEPNSNSFSNYGSCNIANSNLNPTKENYFYDFSYYYRNGFLNAAEVEKDLYFPYSTESTYLGYYALLRNNNLKRDKNTYCLQAYLSRYDTIEGDYQTAIETRDNSIHLIEDYISNKGDIITRILTSGGYSPIDITNVADTARKICKLMSSNLWPPNESYTQYNIWLTWYKTYNNEWNSKVKTHYESYIQATNDITAITPSRNACINAIKDLNKNLELLKLERQRIERIFQSKYWRFIKEGTWQSEEYSDPDLYYLDAASVLHSSAQPKVSYTINVIDLSNLEKYALYNFEIGDRTYIEDTEFFGWNIVNGVKTPYRLPIVITQTSTQIDDPGPSNMTITVQNFRDNFEDMFQKLTAEVQSLKFSEGSYKRAAEAFGGNGISSKALQSALSNNKINIKAAQGGNTFFGEKGLETYSKIDKTKGVKLTDGGIYFTSDGGYTWQDFNSIEFLTL